MAKKRTRRNRSIRRKKVHHKSRKHRKKGKKSRKVSKKHKKSASVSKKTSSNKTKSKKSAKKGGKKKLNSFFALQLKAKKNNEPSFTYNGKKYVKKTKAHLVFYKSA